MKRTLVLILSILAVTTFILTGCSQPAQAPSPTTIPTAPSLYGAFKIIGSNTVTPISTLWAESFMKTYPKVNISVSGPGSGAGIAALIDGTTDVCQSSRKIKQSEIDQAKAKGINPYEIQIASDGLSIVVNPSNPVSELTIEQLSAIYTNKITNWKEVGGSDTPIVALSRDTNSGTHVFFKEHVVQMDGLPTKDTKLEYGSKVLMLPSTEEGVTEVTKNVNTVFYPGLGYVSDKVKLVKVKRTASDTGVLPSEKTVLDGSYPVARPLLFYTNGAPSGIIKEFIDYALSPEGQKQVAEVGYIPIKK